jgi:hypothetical protein
MTMKAEVTPQGGCSRPGWLPIDSAPKDGRPVLVWSGGEVHVAVYIPEATVWMQRDGEFVLTAGRGLPTHWMPVPPPPLTDPR